MKVTIFGSGYVGLVTGACMADAGNDVICVDIDEAKIAALKAGDIVKAKILDTLEYDLVGELN